MKREATSEIEKIDEKKVKTELVTLPPNDQDDNDNDCLSKPDYTLFKGKTISLVEELEPGEQDCDLDWKFKFTFNDKTSLVLKVIDNWGVSVEEE